MTPEVIEDELVRLPDDLDRLAADLGRQVRDPALAGLLGGVGEVLVVGSGDSLHAGLATQLAFARRAGVTARPLSVHAFPAYADEWLAPSVGRRLVVVVSASGRTPGALASASAAGDRGVPVLALVGDRDAPLAAAADGTLAYALPDRVRSPGVRTYQAALAGLLLLAGRLGGDPGSVEAELTAVAGALRTGHLPDRLAGAGDLGTGPMIALGAGPLLGAAKHTAAKVVEIGGVLAGGQELEEWWHVERMADPADMTTFVLATPRSADRAAEIAAAAVQRGRRVLVAAPPEVAATEGAVALPVPDLPEELAALAHQALGVLVGVDVARRLGRSAFGGGR